MLTLFRDVQPPKHFMHILLVSPHPILQMGKSRLQGLLVQEHIVISGGARI